MNQHAAGTLALESGTEIHQKIKWPKGQSDPDRYRCKLPSQTRGLALFDCNEDHASDVRNQGTRPTPAHGRRTARTSIRPRESWKRVAEGKGPGRVGRRSGPRRVRSRISSIVLDEHRW
jgi:hypothetical protein